MRPTECDRCEPFFTSMIQAEARMILVKAGPSAARAFVDEKLEDVHAEHGETDLEAVD